MARRPDSPEPPFHYHYSREDRLSRPDAPDLSRRGRGGILRGNRSLAVLLIDILLISLLFLAYRYLLYSPPHQGELAGYDLVLDGVSAGDRVFAGLRVERAEDDAAEGRVFVRFSADRFEVRESGVLPAGRGETEYVAAVLFVQNAPRELTAEVEIGGRSTILVKTLRPGGD